MTTDHNEMVLLVAREQTRKLEAFKMDEKTLNHREFMICENMRNQF